MIDYEPDAPIAPAAGAAARMAAGSELELGQELEDVQAIANLGLWRWRTGSQTFSWSDQLYRIFGRDRNFEVTLDSTFACIHAEDREAAMTSLQKAVREAISFGHDFRIVRPDGSVRYCWAKVRPVVENGVVVAVHGVCLDITERREAEERQRESDEHYRHTIELSPQVPWTMDPDGRLTSISPRWSELSGLSRAVALESGWRSLTHPEDAAMVEAAAAHSLRTGELFDVTSRKAMADGGYRWIRSRAYPRRDADGRIVRWYGTSEDVHDQVEVEARLRESEEHYRYTVELHPQIPWTADPEGNILEVGPRWVEQMGLPREAALGQGWIAALHPDDADQTLALWSQALGSGGAVDICYRLRQSDGSYRWFRARAAARRDAAGAIIRWYGLLEDIHERMSAQAAQREIKARLRAIIEATPDCIVIVAADGRIIQINPAGLAMIDAASAECVIGTSVYDLIAPEHRAAWGARHAQVIAGARLSWEYDLLGSAGVQRQMEIHSVPFQMPDGATALLGISRDISKRRQAEADRREAEQALKQLQAELVHVSRVSAMGAMASALAHELNQPLTAATNYLRAGVRMAARHADVDPVLPEVMTKAADQTFRAGEIVRRLRGLIAKRATSLETISVQQTIDEALALSLADARSLGVAWQIDLDPAAPCFYADRVQIEQVLINLVRNAIDAMRDSPVKMLSIRTRGVEPNLVRVEIVDSGPGLATEISAQLFTAFATTKKDGMGIGLSISRTIIEAHGGRIWAENQSTGGVRFSFTLPAVAAAGRPLKAAERAAAAPRQVEAKRSHH